MLVVLIILTLIGATGLVIFYNPYFDNTPYERTLLIAHHFEVKGAWGKYYNLVYKGDAKMENILVERTPRGKQIMEKLLSHQNEKISYISFRLKIVSRCDVRHGCFEVVIDILEEK